MIHVLRRDGFAIEKRRLQRIRLELGLRRTIHGLDKEEVDRILQQALRDELDKGVIEAYGRTHLYYHFRMMGYVLPRTRLLLQLMLLSRSDTRESYTHDCPTAPAYTMSITVGPDGIAIVLDHCHNKNPKRSFLLTPCYFRGSFR